MVGLPTAEFETFSNDSSRLASEPLLERRSTGNVAMWFENVVVVLGVSGSEDSDTECNEEMEDAGAWPFLAFSDCDGGYVCSTVSESE